MIGIVWVNIISILLIKIIYYIYDFFDTGARIINSNSQSETEFKILTSLSFCVWLTQCYNCDLFWFLILTLITMTMWTCGNCDNSYWKKKKKIYDNCDYVCGIKISFNFSFDFCWFTYKFNMGFEWFEVWLKFYYLHWKKTYSKYWFRFGS